MTSENVIFLGDECQWVEEHSKVNHRISIFLTLAAAPVDAVRLAKDCLIQFKVNEQREGDIVDIFYLSC